MASTKPIICPQCEREVELSTTFCQNCGTNISLYIKQNNLPHESILQSEQVITEQLSQQEISQSELTAYAPGVNISGLLSMIFGFIAIVVFATQLYFVPLIIASVGFILTIFGIISKKRNSLVIVGIVLNGLAFITSLIALFI